MGIARTTGRMATRTGSKGFSGIVGLTLRLAFGCLFGWWYDRPGMVTDRVLKRVDDDLEPWCAAAFYPAFALWIAAGVPHAPQMLSDQINHPAQRWLGWTVIATAWAALVLMRRLMATYGTDRTVPRLLRDARRWLAHFRALSVALAVGVIALPAFWATTTEEDPRVHVAPVALVLLAGAFIALREANWRRRCAPIRRHLVQVHRVTEREMETALLMPRRGGKGLSMLTVPPAVVSSLGARSDPVAKVELDERLAAHLPEFEAHVARTAESGRVTSIHYAPVSEETLRRRDLRQQTGGLVEWIEEVDNPAKHRPGETRVTLSAKASDSKAAEVDRVLKEHLGLTIVEWPEQARTVTAARLDDMTLEMRRRIAEWRKEKHVHLVEIRLIGAEEAGSLGAVEIVRATVIPDALKRRQGSKAMMEDLLPPEPGLEWVVTDRPAEGVVRIDVRKDPLDVIVPFDADPSTRVTPSTAWQVGIDEYGAPVGIRLDKMAHGLIAGATRSGKSVCTYSLITHVLRMGPAARLLVADPNDTTLAPFIDHVSASTTATHPDEVTAMLEWAREEMDRRKPLMREMRTDAITEFSAHLPLIIIIIDEAANYLRHSDKNAVAALRSELLAVVSQGAKYGIRLILITQRPDSTILDTATRAQLSFRLSFRLEDKETATMIFPDFEDPTTLLSCQVGVGWLREVASEPRRIRSVFIEDHWGVAEQIPTDMPKIISTGQPLVIAAPTLAAGRDEANVIDIDPSDFEFTLDDLDPTDNRPLTPPVPATTVPPSNIWGA